MQTITRADLKRRLDAGERIVLIDAQAPEAFADHLPGAINIPTDEIPARASQLISDKGATVVTYCSTLACTASEGAARALEALGYTNVIDYEAGKSDWVEAGLPTEAIPAA